jgi:hypothetical protein
VLQGQREAFSPFAGYQSFASQAKAHTRIVWDCAWLTADYFVTVSRDKTVSRSRKAGQADSAKCKLWRIAEEQVQLVQTVALASSATATDATEYHSRQATTARDLQIAYIRSRVYVAVGTEEGSITLFVLENGQLERCMQVPDK